MLADQLTRNSHTDLRLSDVQQFATIWLALATAFIIPPPTRTFVEAQERADTLRTKSAPPAPKYEKDVPPPTILEVPYGEHERQRLDCWQAPSDEPTPLVLVIHGGAWRGGSKERVNRFVDVVKLLDAGISVVAINYRYVSQADPNVSTPPVHAPLHDAARALQFIRSKANDWNLDKSRCGAAGGSAGACSSLWLAFHGEMKDSNSPDPISRESTRLQCAAVQGAQTTLDPKQMREWTPNSKYGGHAFGIQGAGFDAFYNARSRILSWIKEYSPYALVSNDDPPVALYYNSQPALGKPQKDPTHTANFGIKLLEHCHALGTECHLVHPGITTPKYPTPTDFLIRKLTSKRPSLPLAP